MEWLSARWRFIRETKNSWAVRLLWWSWVVLSALSTLSLVVPQIRQYVPSWYVWTIGFLLISLIAVADGGFRQVQKLKGFYDPVKLSLALSALPVYFDDLRVELKTFCRGTTLDLTETTFFLKLSLLSDDDTGIKEMGITCTIDGRIFQGKPMDDLSGWLIRTPFSSREYPYKNFEEHSLEKFSLWKKLQQMGLKSGLVRNGWIGFRIPELIPLNGEDPKVRVDITKPQRRQSYRFRFSKWPECETNIFDIRFRV